MHIYYLRLANVMDLQINIATDFLCFRSLVLGVKLIFVKVTLSLIICIFIIQFKL